jgi:hypothetical protein
MHTYTVTYRDGTTDHTFAGMQDVSLEAYVSALVINPTITLVSVTLDEQTDVQLDDIELARAEDGINP